MIQPWDFSSADWVQSELRNRNSPYTRLLRKAMTKKRMGKPFEKEVSESVKLSQLIGLDRKIDKFYSSYPSHLNEKLDGSHIVYFMAAIDEKPMLKVVDDDLKKAFPVEFKPDSTELVGGTIAEYKKGMKDMIESEEYTEKLVDLLFKHCGHVKIGTTQGAKTRLSALQTGNMFNLKIIYWFRGGFEEENMLHGIFSSYLYKPREWFLYTDLVRDYISTMQVHARLYDKERDETNAMKLIKLADEAEQS